MGVELLLEDVQDSMVGYGRALLQFAQLCFGALYLGPHKADLSHSALTCQIPVCRLRTLAQKVSI